MVDEKDTEHELEPTEDAENLPENQDEIELETAEELSGNKLKELREKLKVCEEEKRQHLEDLQRAKADFLNSRRRLEEQLARDRERAKDGILEELLTLSDSFETALADPRFGDADEQWRTGIEAIYAKLVGVLKGNGVEPIEALGKPFDPAEHEAVSSVTVENSGHEETVAAVLQKGWKRGETVLRPAKVTVGTK